MDKLLDLAARCEAATGPDADLDGEIWLAVGTEELFGKSWNYSASLDAAMTLVPEGCGVKMSAVSFEKWAQVVAESKLPDGTVLVGPSLGSAKAATLALALCAAALRARQRPLDDEGAAA